MRSCLPLILELGQASGQPYGSTENDELDEHAVDQGSKSLSPGCGDLNDSIVQHRASVTSAESGIRGRY